MAALQLLWVPSVLGGEGVEVWVPRIPSGIMAEFCHRMFHSQLGLVGIQSSQSFFIWGSQLLSIYLYPQRSRWLEGTERGCSWRRKLLPLSEKEKTRPLTSAPH